MQSSLCFLFALLLCALSNEPLPLLCSEWYSYHFPELVKIVADNYTYARVAQYIGNRKQLTEDKLEGLEKILLDSEKTRAIYDAARSSMGNAAICAICLYILW